MKRNAAIVVEECGGEDSGSLEAHNIFKEYLMLYEDKLEKMMNKYEMTPVEFRDRLEDVLEKDLFAKFMIKYMLVALEFSSFLAYCKDFVSNGGNSSSSDEDDDTGAKNSDRGDSESKCRSRGK